MNNPGDLILLREPSFTMSFLVEFKQAGREPLRAKNVGFIIHWFVGLL